MLRYLFKLMLAGVFVFVVLTFVLSNAPCAPGDPAELRFPSSADSRLASTGTAQAATSSEEASTAATAKAFVGTNQCFTCHRKQADAWHETKHPHAFTHLPEKYQNDSSCLRCHVTGFSQPDGYVAGSEKDLAMVGCETCHGPGAAHIDAAQRFILATPDEEAIVEKELRETIVKTPSDSVCVTCHVMQAHERHPPYEGQLQPAQPVATGATRAVGSVVPCGPMLAVAQQPWATTTISRYSPGYSVKTCGGCHYDEYKNWDAGKHSALAAMVPAAHRGDKSCQDCHTPTGVAPADSTAGADQRGWIGVGCETCHGPSLEHVRFSRQFISGPPLGPRLEHAARHSIRKGKPVATCIQCHVRERHQPHPQFDEKPTES